MVIRLNPTGVRTFLLLTFVNMMYRLFLCVLSSSSVMIYKFCCVGFSGTKLLPFLYLLNNKYCILNNFLE